MAEPTSFRSLARCCEELLREPSKLRKMRLIGQFLQALRPNERAWAARLLIGHPLPETEQKQLHVGGAQLASLASAPVRKETLLASEVTIEEVGQRLLDVAGMNGVGSVRRREAVLIGLLHRLAPADREWLLRILSQQMRHGVNEGVLLEAVARHTKIPVDEVRRAHMLRGDTGEVVSLAYERDGEALRRLQLRLFHPMRVMMAETALDPAQALAEHGGRTAFEYKFDGARVVIHRSGDEVRVFSRRLNDVTLSVPEVVEQARSLGSQDFVAEGEAVGIDADAHPLPFQELMRRFRRVNDLAGVRKQVGVRVYLFDLLHLDGKTLLDKPYEERWRMLEQTAPPELLAPRIVTDDPAVAGRFFESALKAGHEGIVAKSLSSTYMPGKRGAHWLKVKHVKTLDLVILGAEWGTGRRQGWLSNYHLGVRVPPEDEALVRAPPERLRAPSTHAQGYVMVGKTFKGPTDEEFRSLTQRLQQAAQERPAWGVVVPPRFVVEVEYNDIQASPHYPGGVALRFARIRRLREDKSVRDIDTLGTLHRLAALERARATSQPARPLAPAEAS